MGLVSSFDPDADERPRRRWPVEQPQEAIDAACFAGFMHFTRERDPARGERRYADVKPKAKADRAEEFLVMARAFVAAGGRI